MTGPSSTLLTHFRHFINVTKNRNRKENKKNREIPPILLLLRPSQFLLHHIKISINLIRLNFVPGRNSVRPLPIPIHPPRAIGVFIELKRIGPGGVGEGSSGDGGAHVKVELLAILVVSAMHGRCAAVLHC